MATVSESESQVPPACVFQPACLHGLHCLKWGLFLVHTVASEAVPPGMVKVTGAGKGGNKIYEDTEKGQIQNT